jgi:hypothetical protein
MFPTCVLDKDLDRFPEVDEVVNMSEYTVHNQRSLAPDVQGPGGVKVTLGAIHQQMDRIVHGLLHLRTQKPSFNEVRWLVALAGLLFFY